MRKTKHSCGNLNLLAPLPIFFFGATQEKSGDVKIKTKQKCDPKMCTTKINSYGIIFKSCSSFASGASKTKTKTKTGWKHIPTKNNGLKNQHEPCTHHPVQPALIIKAALTSRQPRAALASILNGHQSSLRGRTHTYTYTHTDDIDTETAPRPHAPQEVQRRAC